MSKGDDKKVDRSSEIYELIKLYNDSVASGDSESALGVDPGHRNWWSLRQKCVDLVDSGVVVGDIAGLAELAKKDCADESARKYREQCFHDVSHYNELMPATSADVFIMRNEWQRLFLIPATKVSVKEIEILCLNAIDAVKADRDRIMVKEFVRKKVRDVEAYRNLLLFSIEDQINIAVEKEVKKILAEPPKKS